MFLNFELSRKNWCTVYTSMRKTETKNGGGGGAGGGRKKFVCMGQLKTYSHMLSTQYATVCANISCG
jgi:hypothetical protein